MTSYCVKDQWRDCYQLISKRLQRPQTVEFSLWCAWTTHNRRFLRRKANSGIVHAIVASCLCDEVVYA